MTRVISNGIEVGCTHEFAARAYQIDAAMRYGAAQLLYGNTLPNEFTIQGEKFTVQVMTGLNGNDSADNVATINSFTNSNKSRPTLVIVPPGGPYRYSNETFLSSNTFVGAYHTIFKPRAVPPRAPDDLGENALGQGLSVLENTRWNFSSNSGMAGAEMIGHPRSLSRWPDRLKRNNYLEAGGKLTPTGLAKTHNRGDVDAWFYASAKSNIFMLNMQVEGSITGGTRIHNCTNCLFDGVNVSGVHSDSHHVVKASKNCTVRRCTVLDGGDDCISLVTYGAPDPLGPEFNLIEYNIIYGSRNRGIICTGSRNVFRGNIIRNTSMAPILVHTADQFTQANATANQILGNRMYRSPLIDTLVGYSGNNAPGILLRTGNTFAIASTRCENNEAYTYDQAFGPAGSGATNIVPCVRLKNEGGGITGTIDTNNTLEEYNPDH